MFVKFVVVFEDLVEGEYIVIVNCDELGILCYVGEEFLVRSEVKFEIFF